MSTPAIDIKKTEKFSVLESVPAVTGQQKGGKKCEWVWHCVVSGHE